MKRIHTNKGITLVETMIGVAVFVFLLGAITLFARNLWVYNDFLGESLGNADTNKKLLQTIAAEIRTAASGNNGGYAVVQATNNSFTFYSDTNDDGLKEKIRYFLNGTNFQKGSTIPTGSPLNYVAANEKITTLAANVTNTTLFDYYDKNYDGNSAAMSSPVDVASVRLVKVTITVDKNGNRPPAPATFSTQVSLRNIKDNL